MDFLEIHRTLYGFSAQPISCTNYLPGFDDSTGH
jgi:hypothetical protein